MTEEIQSFLYKVQGKIGDKKKATVESVSKAVDEVLSTTVLLATVASMAYITIPLALNPATAPIALVMLLFGDMIVYLMSPKKL